MSARDSGGKGDQSTELDIENSSLCNLFGQAFVLVSFRFTLPCKTVLKSPNKDETAVHGCNPSLSVLVALMSCKANFLT